MMGGGRFKSSRKSDVTQLDFLKKKTNTAWRQLIVSYGVKYFCHLFDDQIWF